MTMTRNRIEELKRLAEKATQDGWFAYNPSISPTVNPQQAFFLNGPQRISIDRSSGFRAEDAQFMAAANPKTILSLLALAERALEPQLDPVTVRKATLMTNDGYKQVGVIMAKLGEPRAYIDMGRVTWGALEPQGQALPKLPPGVWHRNEGSGDFEASYSRAEMKAYGQECYDAGRASQLALPARPGIEQAAQEVERACQFYERQGQQQAANALRLAAIDIRALKHGEGQA